MMSTRIWSLLAFSSAVVLAGTNVHAQSSAEVNSSMEFNFGSPGARSLGLGGAFVALADDATAVFVNPAGLTQLLKTEAAAEGRFFSYTTPFTFGGSTVLPAVQQRSDGSIAGIDERHHTDHIRDLSFASVVVPSASWSAALYRHELANFRMSTRTDGLIFDQPVLGTPQPRRFNPSTSNLELHIVSYGASFAANLGERVSLGVTIARQQLTLDSRTILYDRPVEIKAPADYQNVTGSQVQHGRSDDMSFVAGMLWKVNSHMTCGAAYQQGSDFGVTVQKSDANDGSIQTFDSQFHVPSVFRAGVSYSFPTAIKATAEVDRIRYSRLTQHFVLLFREEPHYRVDDGTEIHLGVQRLLTGETILDLFHYPVVVSLGAWRDPDHRVRYVDANDPQSLLFRRGTAEYHASIGAALVLGDSHEIGVAFDGSRRQKTTSISMVYRY
ncbi:MAG: long-chain fatty acid transport protein [Thermoanaerobaculia bacterium]|jgi:hypothetical protein|nr:long-chain fatty acid transport protein [Thermoanaerobaculia bacterium]MEA2413657.1 long-chain fatty acid transport protein [Thermoanaerobaculia bacterium]